MKKFIGYTVLVLIAVIFIGTAMFLFNKSQEKPITYSTVEPFTTTIIKKTVAIGKVIPRKEINVTSQVSGVVEQLFVEAGHILKKGDLIARITLAPNMVMLNSAESQLEAARINLRNAEDELQRQRKLYADKLISVSEYNRYELNYNLQREAVQAAENNLLLIREGATKKSDLVSNMIRATIDGMVLDIPNKEGAFIVESSTFGAGTTGKIREGMELVLDVGALEGEPFTATLEYISPKGVEDQGTIKFQIRAAVDLSDELFLRANYSANADIVLDKREDILAINERDLLIEGDEYFVEVEVAPQVFEKRKVQTGLSDGINIEIVSGLTKDQKIKQR
jgi:HlyD family secretion protein